MIKGHTVIELKNINTGEKELIEHDNMLTNAVSEFIRTTFNKSQNDDPLAKDGYVYGENDSNKSFLKTLFGGIFVMDRPITEDPRITKLPEGVNVVGCAGYSYSFNNEWPELGSFNEQESFINWEERTASLVFDFSTSQANGTIASVGLTNVDAVNLYFGSNRIDCSNESTFTRNDSRGLADRVTHFGISKALRYKGKYFDTYELENVKFSNGKTYRMNTTHMLTPGDNTATILYIEPATGSMIIMSAIDDNTVTLMDCRLNSLLSSIFNEMDIIEIVREKTIQTPIPIKSWVSAGVFNSEAYILSTAENGSSINPGNNLYLFKTNFDSLGLELIKTFVNQGRNGSLNDIIPRVYNEHLYMIPAQNNSTFQTVTDPDHSNLHVPLRYSLESGNIEMAYVSDFFKNYSALPDATGNCNFVNVYPISGYRVVLYFKTVNGFKISAVWNLFDNTIKPAYGNHTGNLPYPRNYTKNLGDTMLGKYDIDIPVYGSNGRDNCWNLFTSCSDYLATINNLPTSVLKTNEKTMKITYKLSEFKIVEEERD